MSRGKGHVQSGIEAAFDASPHAAFTVEALARIVYSVSKVEKRHRVAISRALNSAKRRCSQRWLG